MSETFTFLCDQHKRSFSYAFQTNVFTSILVACRFSAVIQHSSACIMCSLEKVNRRSCSKIFKKYLVYPFFIFSGEVEKTLMTQAGRLICPMASVCIRVAFNRKKHSGRGESFRLYLINTDLDSFSHCSLKIQKYNMT